MGIKLDIDDLSVDQGRRMCELCEHYILGCSHNSSTFLCEGMFCDEALKYLVDDLYQIAYVTKKGKLLY